MSIKSMAWAWQTELKGNRKLVLLALADHSDDEGKCWPGIKHVAKKCGISRSSLIEQMNELERMGFIIKQSRYAENGSCLSNLYVLNFDQGRNLIHGVDSSTDDAEKGETQSPKSGLRGSKNSASPDPESGRGRVQNLDPNRHIEPSIEPSINNIYINNNKNNKPIDRRKYEDLMKRIEADDIFAGVITS